MTEEVEAEDEILFSPLRTYSARYYALVFCLMASVGWGVYAYYVQYTTGLGVTGMRSVVSWAFYIIFFVFAIGISHAGTLISAILRVSNADWRRPITRMAESITVMAIVVAAIFPLIDLGRPDRILNIFTFARLQSPLVWDFLAIGTYLVGSIIYLYLPLIPDIASCRDRISEASRFRRWLYGKFSLGWSGTKEQEEKLRRGIKIMAAIIIPVAVSVHSVVSWDFAMTLRVEWHSTIFAPYFVAGAIFSGIATIIIAMAIYRKVFHLEQYIKQKHFVNLALMMLALDIAMIYLTVTEYLVSGYGAETLDVSYLILLFFGAYAPYFWFEIVGGLVIPAVLIIFPSTRRSVAWLVVAAVLVDVGMWIERYLLIVPALAVPQLPYALGQYTPSWVEVSIVAAGFAGFALLLAVFSRVFPVVSTWEVKEGSQPSPVSYDKPLPRRGINISSAVALRSHPRRQFIKYVTLFASGSAVGFISSSLGSGMRQAQKSKEVLGASAVVPLSNLGKRVSLEEAKQTLNFQMFSLSHLANTTRLSEVRLAGGNGLVTLLYEDRTMKPLSTYEEPIAIAIFEALDPIIDSPPSYLPDEFVRVKVRGREGSARNADNERMQPGQIEWWSNGVRCSIFANLQVTEMLKMAESMEAA
jgi:Ni/Fe-hydrogenase subunit HybB-like protein